VRLIIGRDDRRERAWIACRDPSFRLFSEDENGRIGRRYHRSPVLTALNRRALADQRVENVSRSLPARGCFLRERAIACRIAAKSASPSRGFVKNSSAPDFIARTDVGISPWQ